MDPNTFAQIQAQAEATYQPPRQQFSATMNQKKKPWWTSLISELGGAGGAAGGAATGAALGSVVPGIGNVVGGLIGAAAGGFLGGTGGRLAENKVRDNKYNLGSALGEGGTDALFSGFAAANDIRKGAKAAKGLSGVAQGLDNPQSLLQAPDKVGLIQSVGKSLKAGASGYGIGSGNRANQLDAAGSDAIANTLKTLKIPATAPETQARMLGHALNGKDGTGGLTGILSAQYAKANVPVTSQEINNLGSDILGEVANTGGLTEGAKKFALDEAQKLTRTGTDVNKVWQYTKELARNKTNFGANADNKLADQEAAARIILDHTRGFLNGKVPGVAQTNDLYHQAKNAEGFILDAAKDKGGGLIQRLASSAPVKMGESKAGALLENIGKLSAGTGGAASQFTNALKVQAPGALFRGASGMNQTDQPTQSQDPQSLLGNTNPTDPQTLLAGQTPQPTPQTGGPSLDSLRQAVSQDLQETGGKNIAHLMQLAQLYGIVDQQGNPVQQGGSAGLGANVGKVSAQQFANAQSGAQGIQQIGQIIQSDPNLLNRSAIPGGSLPIIGGFLRNQAGTGQLDAIAYNAADKYLKLTTGATATDSEIKNTATKLMPRAGDNQATVQTKLKQLEDYYNIYLQGAQ